MPRPRAMRMPTLIASIAAIAAIGAIAAGAPADAAGREPVKTRTVEIPNSGITLRVWEQADAGGNTVPHYSISRDGAPVIGPRRASYVVRLRHGDFDPLAPSPLPSIESRFAAGPDTNLYLVQFVTQTLPEFRDAITAAGGRVRKFIPNHAFVVEMSPAGVARVDALPFVRWVGPFHPAYKLEEPMLLNADRGDALFPRQKYNLMVWEAGMKQKDAVAARIRQLGGIVERDHAGKYLLEATLTPAQLFEVVRMDEIAYIDRWSPFEPDMNIGRVVGGANYIQSQGGYRGAGVRGEVLDQGFSVGHPDLQHHPPILHTPVTADSHGASCSGITFGDGTGDPGSLGLLPEGQVILADWEEVSTGQPRYDHTRELVEEPYNAVFQTTSVGSSRTVDYTTISADTDASLFDFDIVHCQSQSNAGNQESRPQAWAKNIISGGGVYHRDTATLGDDLWGSGGSTGPASDGRIKPTLAMFYDRIRTISGGNGYTQNFGGTSGATPMICGHVGLFFEMWSDGLFGNAADPGGTVFENRAHMTTAKAMLVNTAVQYDWLSGGPNADITRMRQGWGMPDLANMYDQAVAGTIFVVDETDVLAIGDRAIYQVRVPVGGSDELKATMTYADPPGVPAASQHRVNDLNLRVTSPGGTVYWGNNGLVDGLYSTPGGDPNDIDTVENVFIADPEPGTWIVEVIAAEINEDGHVETGGLDADFALVVSGVLSDCLGDLDGNGALGYGDVLAILANWGTCQCPEDIDSNGTAGFEDILFILANWGPCTAGACCLPDAACFVDAPEACAAAGGTYRGNNTTCDETCNGACCLPDGSCEEGTVEADCLAAGGLFGGNGDTCETGCRTAACCLPQSCVVVVEEFCTAMDGTWRTPGSTCETQCDLSADDCANAVVVTDGSYYFSTIGTSEAGPDLPGSCDEGAGLAFVRDVWFRYQAPVTGFALASVCDANFNNRIAIYEDGNCPGDFLACADDVCGVANTRAEAAFPVEAGAVYLVRIGSRSSGSVGTGTLDIASGP